MATLGQATSQVIEQLGPRSDTSISASCQQAILDAVQHYEASRFFFNEGRFSFTASATIYYSFPAAAFDVNEVDMMTVTVSGAVIEVERTTYGDIARKDSSGATGIPCEYAIWNQQFRLYPKPNSTYQIDVDCQKRLATLSSSTDSNAWLTYGLEMIAARATKMLSIRFKDYDHAKAYDLVETEAFNRLLRQTDRLGSSGRISPAD